MDPGAGSRGAEGELGPGHNLTRLEYTCREMTKNSSSEPPDGPGAGSRGAEGELGPGHHPPPLLEYMCTE